MQPPYRGSVPNVDAECPGVVFWDFDGTLAWRDGMWRGSLITALDLVTPGHSLTAADVREGLRQGFPWHRPDEPHGHLDTAELWWDALRPLLVNAYVDAGLDPDSAATASQLVRSVYLDPQYWHVFDDTKPALSHLQELGWRHIVVSNHVPELAQLVDHLGLADFFDEVLTSGLTGYEKPHPEMFALAIKRAGAPRHVWMVGDNPTADVAGASEAGIPALLVRDPGATGGGLDLHQAAAIIIERS
jgi:putative hydrolase of the HAD superfamily